MSASKRLLAIACAFLALSACKKAPEEAPLVEKVGDDSLHLSEEAIRNIKLSKVVLGEFPEKLSLMGKITVPEGKTEAVPARVAGRTFAVYVDSGQVVTAGQPLASIYSADYAIAREEYLQAVKQAKGESEDSEAANLLELSKKKLDAIGVSAVDVEAWTKLDGGAKKSDNLLVRAPLAGALLGKNSTVGALVNIGDTLFTIGDLRAVWFAGDVYPEDLKKVHSGQEVVIESPTGGAPLHGKVSFISPVMDPNTRTIKIRALMNNPGSELRADMYVQGNVVLSKRTALLAPKQSFVRLANDVFCFKRLPGNIFKKVSVTIDGESSDAVSISRGLGDGEEIVSEGGLYLNAALGGAGT
jgi:Cu(I)/Ag(I) efflux system membrane fusion protein